MHVIDLWKGIRKRLASRRISKPGINPGSIPATATSEDFISDCLGVLDSTTVGTALYILSCLCPEDFAVILDLVHLDLGQPHHHRYLPEKHVHVMSSSYPDAISRLQSRANSLPTKVYGRLWLEVAERWLLTCPVDVEYYKPDKSGKDVFCQRLRSELVERILRID